MALNPALGPIFLLFLRIRCRQLALSFAHCSHHENQPVLRLETGRNGHSESHLDRSSKRLLSTLKNKDVLSAHLSKVESVRFASQEGVAAFKLDDVLLDGFLIGLGISTEKLSRFEHLAHLPDDLKIHHQDLLPDQIVAPSGLSHLWRVSPPIRGPILQQSVP